MSAFSCRSMIIGFEESYTFANQTEPMPGWVLTVVWYTEKGLPKNGILQLRMFSGDGMGVLDCRANTLLRRMLLLLVLVDHKDIDLDVKLLRFHGRKVDDINYDDQSLGEVSSTTSLMSPASRSRVNLVKNVQKQLKSATREYFTLGDINEHLAAKTGLTWTYFDARKL